MNLAEYPDEDLLGEVKCRGFEIKAIDKKLNNTWFCRFVMNECDISIGGVRFEFRT